MPLLALTASASIVGGVFIAAQPAYSANEVVGATGQCVTAADEGASIIVSSVVPSGAPLHVEGAGWGPSSEASRGFVIVTLDDGQEVRPDGVTLPAWVPTSVQRNKTAWSVAEVSTTGKFSADIELPSTWTVGSEHSIMIGDGVTGIYVQVSVTVVEAGEQAHACSLTPTDDASVEPTDEPSNQPADEPSTEPDGHATSDVATDGPAESPADNAADNAAKPDFGLTDDASRDAASDASASAPSTAVAPPSPRATPSADASDTSRSSVTPAPSASASSAPSSGGNGSSTSVNGGAGSSADDPSPSPSTEQESVSASQIGPKAHSEQQATNQAVREQESRLNGWILAGGGLLALLGAIVTVSIVRRSHGLLR
ncbi:hypothetical protein [Schaalia sp. ORNL0103]|uniref:hypothetical protein n=2 Tax=Bacteria TaxID=2 RepID=UPI001CEC16A6|nr:hypothetical protein [Schaalia sp. ORNL0103]